MIKAIFTNIKDEHRYLEEWLNYHIKLGFNKFILYEDEGSISHEEIINKYLDIVDIDFYNYVLKKDSKEFKDLTCFKHVYQNYTDIDWLIKLDPDEFISLPSQFTSIDDILSSVQPDINQISLSWKLYNANGFINEPYSGKYSVVNTYLVPIELKDLGTYFNCNTSDNKYKLGKSFIRYKYYKTSFNSILNQENISIAFPHIIFNPNDDIVILDKLGIYINHYITKSFEEFYNKLKNKGEYNFEWHRRLGDFFVLNPDMIEKIPEIENKFDVNVFTFETKLNVTLE